MRFGWDTLRPLAVDRAAPQSCYFRGGCRLDHWTGTWPFAGLAADRERLEVFMLGRPRVVLEKPKLTGLFRYRGFSTSPGIKHAENGYPEIVVFFPLRVRKLEASLRLLGYEFQE